MAGIKDYSTTNLNNTSLNGISVAEGMLPSNLNNAIRALMVNTRSWYNDSQWVEYGDGDGAYTATYASATSFTIAGVDVTPIYHEGRRIKLTATTPGTIYGTISSSTFSTNTTINVTWDSGSLSNEAISNVYISALSKTNNSFPTGVIATATLADGSVTTIKIADSAVTTAKINDAAVTNAKLGADSVNGSKIADDSIDSEHYVDGSIDTQHIANSQITTAKIADNNVTTAKILNSNVTTAKIADLNVTTGKIAADAIDGTKIADDSINSEHYVDGSIDTQHIADSQITTAKVADSNITTAKIADSNVTTAKIADSNITTAKINNDAVTIDKIADAVIVTNAEASGHTPGDTTFFTTSASDGRYFRQDSSETINSGDTWSGSDAYIATTAAIDARIIDLVDDVGGFVAIANEDSFPTTNPDINDGAGTIVSIADAGGMTYNTGTGVSTDAQTTGATTVTINSIPASIGSPIPNGYGMLVETTSTLNTYTFHRLVPIATEVTTVAAISADITAVAGDATDIGTVATDLTGSNNIGTVAGSIANVNLTGGSIANVNTVATNIASVNNFGEVYRISATAPITSLNSGDLYFDTSTNILNVYGASGWQNAGSSVNGTSQRYNYTATASQTTFTGVDNNGNTLAYDAGYIDVYLNGVKLLNGTDVTVTSGSSVVLASGATTGDVVDIVAYGTFSVASLNADNLDSGTVPSARISGAYTGITQTGTLASFASTGIDDNATSTAITIDSSGNVGIGTTAPVDYYADNLVINAQSEGGITLIGTSAHENYLAWADGTSGTERYSGYLSYNHSTNFMRFATNGGLERMRITSSGNVGIGTTAPDAKLHVDVSNSGVTPNSYANTLFIESSSNTGLTIASGTSSYSSIYFANSTDNDKARIEVVHSDNSMRFTNNASERMRIDSSGNVGIGTTSPNNQLEIKSDTATVVARLACNTGTGRDWGVASATDGAFGIYDYDAAAYRMRIDSSGNVLINTTSEATTTAGIKLRATDNSIAAVATSNPSGYFGRLSTDGDIIKLRKDSTTVGSIGVNNSDNIFIGGNVSNHSGIEFSASAVLPRNNNTLLSNTVDLGNSSVLWKDAYLSGGLYVGGTAAANKLDDYEEGSFTAELSSTGATFTYSVRQGWYVKVGNRVMFNIYIQLDGTPFTTTANDTRITGLPFTSGNLSGNDNRMICGTRLVNFSSGQTFLMANIAANANTALLIEGGDNSAGVLLPSNALSNSSGQIFLSGSYQTA
jgi:hypothetical protein